MTFVVHGSVSRDTCQFVIILLLYDFTINTVILRCVLSANCSIEVLSFAANIKGPGCTVRYGYVQLNAVPVWQASWCAIFPACRGVNAFVVDPFSCSVRESRSFDTWVDPNGATELSNFLKQVNRGSIIVGVSADEPTLHLASALLTLREIGADVSDVQYRGSFGFVAQRCFPDKTVLRKVLTEADSFVNPPHFKAKVTGMIYCRNICLNMVAHVVFMLNYSITNPY